MKKIKQLFTGFLRKFDETPQEQVCRMRNALVDMEFLVVQSADGSVKLRDTVPTRSQSEMAFPSVLAAYQWAVDAVGQHYGYRRQGDAK